MIESYAFLAAFAAQILAMSVLHPAWYIKYVRAKATEFPAERFAQLYPDVDSSKTLERYLSRYRALNTFIAALGWLLLGWLFSYVLRLGWDVGAVRGLVTVYALVQVLPLCFVAWIAVRYNKLLERLLEGKRTAILQRRGLFDFVSPFTVFLAVLSYFLFVAYVIYIAQNPFPGFAGYYKLLPVTLVYVIEAFAVYKMLYSRKVNPFETHAARVYTIGLGVKICVYICIAIVVHSSLKLTLSLLDLQRWIPFALSIFFVFVALLCFMVFNATPRRSEADGLGESALS